MTKRSINNKFVGAVVYFIILIVIGIALSYFDNSDKRILYSTFKDLIPLLISIPAAWLAYCVQRRSAYLQQLRSLWSKLVDAIQLTMQYTTLSTPTQTDYNQVLLKLGSAIDEVRGLFCNLKEHHDRGGLYPFEPLKDIYKLVDNLGYDVNFSPVTAKQTKTRIFALWKDVRKELLKEFDREEPTFSHSHWTDLEKAHVYEKHKIPRTPS